MILEPGYFRTSFLANPASGENVAPALEAYKGTPAAAARDNFVKFIGKQMENPEEGLRGFRSMLLMRDF